MPLHKFSFHKAANNVTNAQKILKVLVAAYFYLIFHIKVLVDKVCGLFECFIPRTHSVSTDSGT